MQTLVKQYNSVAVQLFRPVAIKCLYNYSPLHCFIVQPFRVF